MVELRQTLTGTNPRGAVAVVVAVGLATAALLGPFGVFSIPVAGVPAGGALAVGFGLLPALAGGVCGYYRLGMVGAVGSGIAPGAAFVLFVAVGTALEIGSIGGGDAPLVRFGLLLATPGVVLAIIGFGLGVTASRVE